MALTNEQTEALCQALCEVYTEDGFAQMLKFKCGKRLDLITDRDDALTNIVFHVVEAAEREGWIFPLLQGALSDRREGILKYPAMQELVRDRPELLPTSPYPLPVRTLRRAFLYAGWAALLLIVAAGMMTFIKSRKTPTEIPDDVPPPPPATLDPSRLSEKLSDILIFQTGQRSDTLQTLEQRFSEANDGVIPGDFFIGNGKLPEGADTKQLIHDGEIVIGRRWTGADTLRIARVEDLQSRDFQEITRFTKHYPANVVSNALDAHGIDVTLIGDFRPEGAPPTARQMQTLEGLVRGLMKHYHISADHVWVQGEKNPGHPPLPDGGHFDIRAFRTLLRSRQ